MAIIYGILVTIHVIACIFLIAVILLQAGRGGGLVENFNLADSLFGTKTSSLLQKTTTACAIIFIFTCLSLAFLTAQKSKSLIGKGSILEKMVPIQEKTSPQTELPIENEPAKTAPVPTKGPITKPQTNTSTQPVENKTGPSEANK